MVEWTAKTCGVSDWVVNPIKENCQHQETCLCLTNDPTEEEYGSLNLTSLTSKQSGGLFMTIICTKNYIVATLDKLLVELKTKGVFHGEHSTLQKVLKTMGFRYKSFDKNSMYMNSLGSFTSVTSI